MYEPPTVIKTALHHDNTHKLQRRITTMTCASQIPTSARAGCAVRECGWCHRKLTRCRRLSTLSLKSRGPASQKLSVRRVTIQAVRITTVLAKMCGSPGFPELLHAEWVPPVPPYLICQAKSPNWQHEINDGTISKHAPLNHQTGNPKTAEFESHTTERPFFGGGGGGGGGPGAQILTSTAACRSTWGERKLASCR